MTYLSKRLITERPITGVSVAFVENEDAPAAPVWRTLANAPAGAEHPEVAVAEDAPDDLVEAEADMGRDEWLQQAWNAGYQAGMEEGRTARNDGTCDDDAPDASALRQAVQAVQALISSIDGQRRRAVEVTERTTIGLACAVAGKVIRRTVEEDDELVVRVVADALSHADGAARLTLRVNPEDVRRIEAHHDAFLAAVNGCQVLAVEADSKVPRGGCMLDTGSGAIDACLATQVHEIERALMEGKADTR